MLGDRNSKVWLDELDGGYWFQYKDMDGEMTEDGPFATYEEALDALNTELSDLFIEMEGEF